jgi:hypothetical protein
MFRIRPIIPHFLLWMLLAPFFLLELRALEQLQQTLMLQEGQYVATTLAEITAQRMGTHGPEVQYQFHTAGADESIGPMNTSGWGETWVPVSESAWQEAQDTGQISVAYLPSYPQANQPLGRVGSPVGDSIFSWLLFLALDLVWLAESLVIIRNYLRSQVAAERRLHSRIRFWHTDALPSAHERYLRRSNRAR